MQCVNRNWEGEIKQQGDKVKIITPAEVSVSTLTSDSITYSSLTPTSKDLEIHPIKILRQTPRVMQLSHGLKAKAKSLMLFSLKPM